MAIPDIIKITARYLRKNQTVAETIFWNYFRRSTGKSKVYRQKPIAISIDNNNFQRYIIADFYFPQSKLIIEIDGEIHDNQDVYELDREKEVLLETQGYKVVRYRNDDIIQNMNTIGETIISSLS